MRIALLFYGHQRTGKFCRQTIIDNLVRQLQTIGDVFCFMHTWDEIDAKTRNWNGQQIKKGVTLSDTFLEQLRTTFKLRGLLVEHQPVKDEGVFYFKEGKPLDVRGGRCMLHSMLSAYSLAQEFSKNVLMDFDVAIVIRPDLYLTEQFPVGCIEDIDRFCICGRPINDEINNLKSYIGNDLIMMAKFDQMGRVLNKTKENESQTIVNGAVLQAPPEYQFVQAAMDLGLCVSPLPYRMDHEYFILRQKWCTFPKNVIRVKLSGKSIYFQALAFISHNLLRLTFFAGKFGVSIQVGGGFKRALDS